MIFKQSVKKVTFTETISRGKFILTIFIYVINVCSFRSRGWKTHKILLCLVKEHRFNCQAQFFKIILINN